MRKLLVALIVLPLAAYAQAPGPGQGAGGGTGPGGAPGTARGQAQRRPDAQKMERRMRLARTLGLAEALDLDEAQALKLGQQVAKFDDRRVAAHSQLHDARDVLRRAASGEKVPAADVDQAIQKGLDARAQLQAVDRDLVAVVTKDLSPEKRARAVLFLERFQRRFHPGMGGLGHMMGPGMGPGRGMMDHGRGMTGMGPDGGGMEHGAMMGMGPGGPGQDGWDDDGPDEP